MDLAKEEEDTNCKTHLPRDLEKYLRASCGKGWKFSWRVWIKRGVKFGIALVLVVMSYYLVHIYQQRPMYWPSPNHSCHRQRVSEGMLTTGTCEQEIPLPVPRGARRTAICLVGGLRQFQLTGPSIQKFLLNAYGDADVFVHAPVDKDVHKLTILSGTSHLAGARLFVPQRLQSPIANDLLTAYGSPNKIQGLLQYFNLVEGCVRLIEKYESRHNFTYDWIVRTRLDSYWNSPMPPIESLDSTKYTVPYGSDYGGLNDRLGVGTRNTSMVALQRLSSLSTIHHLGLKHLNSESTFKAQLMAGGVTAALKTFPFCVITTRSYIHTPVASIVSKGDLNGAKCWPCRPVKVGEEALRFLGGILGPISDPKLCNGRRKWDVGWEQVYDETGGPEFAVVRKRMDKRSAASCIRDMQLFAKQWDMWSAPPVEMLCHRAGLKASTNESRSEEHE